MDEPRAKSEKPFRSQEDAELLSELRSSLKSIEDSLGDAEWRQFRDEGAKIWLEKAREVKFSIEDLVDETELSFEYDYRPLRSLSHRLFNASSSSSGLDHRPNTIRKVLERSEEVVKEYRDTFGFETTGILCEKKSLVDSVIDETIVYGVEKQKERIVEALLSGPPVITLVGTRGIGKTTLARLVYGDERLGGVFDFKAWVCLSNKFETHRVMRTIRKLLDSSAEPESEDFDVLQLRSHLAMKKFLLVLDDVLDENERYWTEFLAPLLSEAKGSKIILTRQNKTVSSASAVFTHSVERLSEEHCWDMLAAQAFPNENPDTYPNLVSIGKQIAKKCEGLPLAAKLLGGLLCTYREADEWLAVLKSDLWENQSLGNAQPVLGLSFYHLPVKIRQCFAFCSLFPVHYEFRREKLVQMWMAQNYLQSSDGDGTMEEVGNSYFQELVSRSLLVKSTEYSDSVFKMHDLVHELATSVSGGQCLRMERGWSVPRGTVHLRHSQGGLHAVPADNRLRTFIYANSHFNPNPFPLSARTLHDLLQRQTKLRALCLTNHTCTTLPDSILNLKHLRYLDLSDTELSKLPESVCMLYLLESLILTNCRFLTALPQNMWSLRSLSYLDISGTGIQSMPEHMGKLENLKTLTSFVVGSTGSSLRELRALMHLRKLSVSELQNVASASDARQAALEMKAHLSELHLEWSNCFGESRDPCKEEAVLENLKPSTALKRLTVQFYGGKRFTDWLGNSSFSSMVFMRISDCCNCSSLPPLGKLASLEHLILERISSLRSINNEFYGGVDDENPFPNLKVLMIEEMPALEQWIASKAESEEFPCLRKFYVRKCPKLRNISLKCLPSLIKLEISECQVLEQWTTKMPLLREKFVPSSLRIVENLTQMSESLQADDHPVNSSLSEDISVISVPRSGVSTVTLEETLYTSKKSVATQTDDETDTFISKDSEGFVPSSGIWSVSDSTELNQLPRGGIQILKVERCDATKELPSSITGSKASLQHLYIIDCFSIKSFPRSKDIPLLKTLYIRNCKKLEFPKPGEENQYKALEHLSIGSSCDALECFALMSFPELRSLCLSDCKNLKALLEPFKHKTWINTLEITDCPEFESFPDEEFPGPHLKSIVLSNCKKLKSFPRIHVLKSLRSLHVDRCPELVFQFGFPLSLSSLCIACENLVEQENWSLSKLQFLSHFEIEGGRNENLESFPKEGQLPKSLTYLRMSKLKKLKFLDAEGFGQLTSLQTLVVESCVRLRSLSGPLPASLSSISISKCPFLEAKLQNKKGNQWSEISHVSRISIGGEELQEQF